MEKHQWIILTSEDRYSEFRNRIFAKCSARFSASFCFISKTQVRIKKNTTPSRFTKHGGFIGGPFLVIRSWDRLTLRSVPNPNPVHSFSFLRGWPRGQWSLAYSGPPRSSPAPRWQAASRSALAGPHCIAGLKRKNMTIEDKIVSRVFIDWVPPPQIGVPIRVPFCDSQDSRWFFRDHRQPTNWINWNDLLEKTLGGIDAQIHHIIVKIIMQIIFSNVLIFINAFGSWFFSSNTFSNTPGLDVFFPPIIPSQPTPGPSVLGPILSLIVTFLNFYQFALFIRIILTWLPIDLTQPSSPAQWWDWGFKKKQEKWYGKYLHFTFLPDLRFAI